MRQLRFLGLFAFLLYAASIGTPALAQEAVQPQVEPQQLMLTTLYPSQETALGQNVTLALTLRAGKAETVRLETQDLPEGWTATFRGEGKVIHAAYVEPGTSTSVDLRLDPAPGAAPGTYHFTVLAQGEGEKAELAIELIVQEKLPPSLEWQVDLPTLRGAPGTTFHYNATLKNTGDEDLSVNLVANAPSEFQVSFTLSGQDVTNIPVAASESKRLSIEVQPSADVQAGDYPIAVQAQGGETQATLALTASVTGKVNVSLTTPDGRLSGTAHAGEATSLKLVVQNTGSAPAHNIKLTSTQPTDWSVKFDPEQVAELPANQQIDVTANVQPASNAVAGDYVVTMDARPEEGTAASADFRITVLTSTLWGIVGVALIAVAVAVVGLAVMRFGRR
jgi:uncharacterized membrane protein